MPRRFEPLVNEQFYHIFNRGVNKQPICFAKKDYVRAIESFKFYLTPHPPVRYSRFINLPSEERKILLQNMDKKEKLVDLIAYCLMPNHFHLLLKQNIDDGITMLMRNFQISYTKYLNTKYDRTGPLLQGQFKVARIEDDEQLLHVSRYIHLNPFTSYHLGEIESLTAYPWSSLAEYLDLIEIENEICKKELILSNFKNKDKYKEFIFNQADYQRKLENIKHLILE